jgi:hypothetical protein
VNNFRIRVTRHYYIRRCSTTDKTVACLKPFSEPLTGLQPFWRSLSSNPSLYANAKQYDALKRFAQGL